MPNYYDPCNLTLMALDDPCGCAFTNASLYALDSEALKNRNFYEEGLARTYAQVREGRKCGVAEDPMMVLLLSRLKSAKSLPAVSGLPLDQWSHIAPYFEIPYQGVINSNHFVIESGTAGQGKKWILTITNTASQWGTDLPNLERYFIPGYYIHVSYNSADGIGHHINLQIVEPQLNGDAGGVNKAIVTVEPPYSDAGWDALTGAQQAVYQPTGGLVELLANNISDLTSHCINKASNISWKFRDYWWQTIRGSFCISDAYLEAINNPLIGQFQRRFQMLPVAQQRKQHEEEEQKEFWNTVLWGTRINENQTKALYRSLPQINDPADETCPLEFQSNLEGIFPQLVNCNIPTDMEGGELDLDAVLVKSEYLARYRGEKTGEYVNRVEWMTDRTTANAIREKYIAYMKAKWGIDDITLFYKPGEKMKFTVDGATKIVWNYDLYLFPDNQIELAVLSHRAFDDRLLAAPTAHRNVNRFFMALDWTDIDIIQAWNHTVVRQTNEADELYKCVIKIPKTKYFLKSVRDSVVVNDPNRHMIYYNFGAYCPKLTASTCSEHE